jgi:hypothetical protein
LWINKKSHQVWAVAQHSLKVISPESSLTQNLKHTLISLDLPLQACAEISFFYAQEKFCFLPENLHLDKNARQVLSYSCTLTDQETVQSEHWATHQCILLYSVPQELKQWLEQAYPQSTLQHQASSYASLYALAPLTASYLHLHVQKKVAHFFMAHNKKLQLYQHFSFNTHQDLLYYLLFALEQNGVLATEVKLFISGQSLKGDDLYKLLTRHIGEVAELPLPKKLKYGPNLTAREIRRYSNLFALL